MRLLVDAMHKARGTWALLPAEQLVCPVGETLEVKDAEHHRQQQNPASDSGRDMSAIHQCGGKQQDQHMRFSRRESGACPDSLSLIKHLGANHPWFALAGCFSTAC